MKIYNKEKIDLFINSNYNLFLLILSFIAFTIWFFLIGHKLLNQSFIWDDLHLMRSYSRSEMIDVWFGNWDLDNIETPSYRPVAIFFYSSVSALFGDSFLGIRFFTFLLMIMLIFSINIFLTKIGLKKNEIIIFTILITLTKIYTTLISFISLSALTFCYICAFISITLFLKWLKEKKIKYYLMSLFLAFISIFTREELYFLPGILFLISINKFNFTIKELKKIMLPILSFLILVLLHMYLRSKLVPEAENFGLSKNGITFGDELLNYKKMIFAFLLSWLPMGIDIKTILNAGPFSLNNISFFTLLIWILSLIFLVSIIFHKNLKYLLIKRKVLIFLLISILTCLPSLTYIRSFGIFISSVFSLTIIAILLNNFAEIIKKEKHKRNLQKTPMILIIFFVVSSAGIGGGLRSWEQIKAMDHFSAFIVHLDASIVYNSELKIAIPPERLERKIQHLESLSVYRKEENIYAYKNLSTKIKYPKYNLLDF